MTFPANDPFTFQVFTAVLAQLQDAKISMKPARLSTAPAISCWKGQQRGRRYELWFQESRSETTIYIMASRRNAYKTSTRHLAISTRAVRAFASIVTRHGLTMKVNAMLEGAWRKIPVADIVRVFP